MDMCGAARALHAKATRSANGLAEHARRGIADRQLRGHGMEISWRVSANSVFFFFGKCETLFIKQDSGLSDQKEGQTYRRGSVNCQQSRVLKPEITKTSLGRTKRRKQHVRVISSTIYIKFINETRRLNGVTCSSISKIISFSRHGVLYKIWLDIFI
jgi:hypothetical protein